MFIIYSRNSFIKINDWIININNYASNDCKICLIGNKVDLEDSRQVSKNEGENYKKTHNLDFFMECSAKNGFNAQNLFITAAKFLYWNSKYFEQQISEKKKIWTKKRWFKGK